MPTIHRPAFAKANQNHWDANVIHETHVFPERTSIPLPKPGAVSHAFDRGYLIEWSQDQHANEMCVGDQVGQQKLRGRWED